MLCLTTSPKGLQARAVWEFSSHVLFAIPAHLYCISISFRGPQTLGDDAYNKHDKYVSEAVERTAEPGSICSETNRKQHTQQNIPEAGGL